MISKQLFKFMIVGGIGFIINAAILYILTEKLNIYYMISALISLQCSIPVQFILNNTWTFKDKLSFKKFIKYESLSAAGVFLYYIILILLTELLGVYYLISSLLATFIVFLFNYHNSKKYVWKK